MSTTHVHVQGMAGAALLGAERADVHLLAVARLNMVHHAVLVAVCEPALQALEGFGTQTNKLALQICKYYKKNVINQT